MGVPLGKKLSRRLEVGHGVQYTIMRKRERSTEVLNVFSHGGLVGWSPWKPNQTVRHTAHVVSKETPC